MPAGERDAKLSITRVPLLLHPPASSQPPKVEETQLEEQSGSGLTPPPTPNPIKDQTPTTYARARTILVSNDAIQSLVPATLLSQAESLLSAGRTKDVLRLLEGVRKRGGDEDQVRSIQSTEIWMLIMIIGHASPIYLYPNRIFSVGSVRL